VPEPVVVGVLLARAEQPIVSVADDDIDATEIGEASVDHVADGYGVGDVEDLGAFRRASHIGSCSAGAGVA
jgi:hypothetical protein